MTTRLWPFQRQSFVMVAILLLALGTTAARFWWLCDRNNGIAFLPSSPGAEWIVYPKPPDAMPQQTVLINGVFRYTFTLNTPPERATLTVRALKSAAVVVNGQKPDQLELTGENWKSPSTADVTRLLRAGTNDITAYVTNVLGPPALWLRLQTGQQSQGTDERWRVSLAGATWQNARRAAQPPTIRPENILYGGERTMDSVKRVWPVMAGLCALSLFMVWGASRWLRQRGRQLTASTTDPSARLIYGLFIIVAIARIALFINNLPQLPRSVGFDANGHEEYIRFIQEKGTLPSANDGWEMYQPPLYYGVSASLLNAVGLSVNENDGLSALRSVNCVVGLVHCWLALLCLRLLFPENPAAQAAGLLIAAFLPPHLYLSQYVTNEPMAGLFATVAFYLCLRALRAEKDDPYLYLGIGTAMGLAMLTKFSFLLALPLFPAAFGLRLMAGKNYAPRDWLKSLGLIALACLVVCGWHYGHVWAQFGRPIVGNWEANSLHPWWQDPGFRTSAYYFSFGHSLISPLFSEIHSFADGFYSTLWGDGLISGTRRLACRPPWNYDLMNGGYLLSLGMSLLLIVGFVLALANFIRRPTPEWLMILGSVLMFGLGILLLSLYVPAQIKAFYGFPALVPFSALVAAGWNWLSRKHPAIRTVLWVFLLGWTMTVYTAFWIRSSNPEVYRVRGIYQIMQHNDAEALASISQALQLNPDDADAHCVIAELLNDQDQEADEAVQHYREALRIRPDFPEALNNLARMLVASKEADIRNAADAIPLAERACELTLHGTPDYISTLAVAYAKAGRFDEAMATAQKACASASESGDQNLLKQNQGYLAMNLNNLAWTLATSKDTHIRNGERAVQLAELACDLTHYSLTFMVGTLAAAYAEAGRFDDAIATAQKACALASEAGEPDLLKKNQELLALYLKHQPYHEGTEKLVPAAP
jgi:4-amino-4-deoxy-L-arabinose transferase-like glycosyltransferase